jgi:hypothetical protein
MHTSEAPTAETGETPKTAATYFPEFYGDGCPLQALADIKPEDGQDLCDFLAELQSERDEAAA